MHFPFRNMTADICAAICVTIGRSAFVNLKKQSSPKDRSTNQRSGLFGWSHQSATAANGQPPNARNQPASRTGSLSWTRRWPSKFSCGVSAFLYPIVYTYVGWSGVVDAVCSARRCTPAKDDGQAGNPSPAREGGGTGLWDGPRVPLPTRWRAGRRRVAGWPRQSAKSMSSTSLPVAMYAFIKEPLCLYFLIFSKQKLMEDIKSVQYHTHVKDYIIKNHRLQYKFCNLESIQSFNYVPLQSFKYIFFVLCVDLVSNLGLVSMFLLLSFC